jgi:hypothetical protein
LPAGAVAGAVLVLYLLLFLRGLGWQWQEVAVAPGDLPPVASGSPVGAAERGRPAAGAGTAGAPPVLVQGRPVTQPNAQPNAQAKVPLPPTDEPPPRGMTDERGVTYDAAGVAVMGIEADTGGVYNVPPGRQVRIGGASGQLYDVQPGGKITPATQVKQWPG